MSLVNIGGSNNAHDRSYRYKRPRVATKIEGRGNGIKTVITNMSDLARSLNTHPTYPTKYFGCELGAQSKYDEKTGFATVNGAFDAPDLDKMLEGFISGFILCPKCALPETTLKVGRNEVITADCKACGYNGPIPGQLHKVVTYIARNPPGSGNKKLKASMSKKDLKKEKKAAAFAAANAAANDEEGATTTDTTGADGGEPDEGELDDDNGPPEAGEGGVTDSVVEGEVLLGAPELSNATAGDEVSIVEDDEKVDWSVDTSKEAKKARRELLLAGGAGSEARMAASMSMTSLTSASVQGGNTTAAIRMLEPLIDGGTAADDTVISGIKRVSVAESLTKVQRVIIMWEALFALDGVIAAKAAKARVKVIRSVVVNEETQLQLLNCMEMHVGVLKQDQLPHTQAFLMLFYDEDLVDEDVIKSWFAGPSAPGVDDEQSAPVRAAAEAFIKWLDEADEESSDDEE